MNKRFGLVFVVSMVLGGCSAPLADFNSGDGGGNADGAVVPVGDASGSCTMVPGACGVGNRCDNGRCVAGCGGDGDCNSGQVCNTSTRTCAVSDGGVVSDASVCGEGQTRCNGACVNCQTDAMHCGTCGRTCNAGQSCVAGVCTGGSPTCTGSGETYCSGACVNTNTNASHCGGCGRVCSSGQVCASGSCVVATPPPGDAGMTPFRQPAGMTVTLSAAQQAMCPGGYVLIGYGPIGEPIDSNPGQPLTLTFTAAWRGYVNVGARCGDVYMSWAPTDRTARAAGVSSIVLRYVDGSTPSELVDIARTCGGGGPGVKLQVPIDGIVGSCRI